MKKNEIKERKIFMESNILDLLKIPNVSPQRHYWIIRTNSGDYYDDFILHQYISIAWDYVTLNILNNQTEDSIKRLIEVYESSNINAKDEDEDESDGSAKGKITAIYNKIARFVFEIQKGDVILIPSKNSDNITIAEVIGDTYETQNYVEDYLKLNPETEIHPCPYQKRRKIKTLKTISKRDMDIYLAKGFNSQHALSNMDEYSSFIDRTIYDIYAKGDKLHTTIHAGHPNGLSLKELVSLASTLEESAASIAQQCGIPFDSSDVEVKLNIHSPGLIELIGAIAGSGIVLSLLMFSLNNMINGGKLSISFKSDEQTGKIDFSVNSESIGLKGHKEKIDKLELKKKTDLIQMINDLDIRSPEIICSILNGEKITPDMIVEISNNQELPSKPEDTVE